MIELTPVRLMRVVKKTKARVHTLLINLTMVIRYTVILADKHTMQNKWEICIRSEIKIC